MFENPKNPAPSKCLTFSPLAWLKLQHYLRAGPTEVGGFGVSADDAMLYVWDFHVPKQTATSCSVCFDDASVADYFDAMVDSRYKPSQFARIWIHTHPGASADPSGKDEETLRERFGACDWVVMFIISQTSETYCRLRIREPRIDVMLPVKIDWENTPSDLPAITQQAPTWQTEYEANVIREALPMWTTDKAAPALKIPDAKDLSYDPWEDFENFNYTVEEYNTWNH